MRRDAVAAEAGPLGAVVSRAFGLEPDAAARLVEDGAVFLGGKRQRDPAHRVTLGARLVLHTSEAAAQPAEPSSLRVLFEDEGIIVLDKAAGDHLNETETSARPALVEQLRPRHPELRVVHRLDRETSGVVVLAKDRAWAERLSACFRERRAAKIYLAITDGAPPEGLFEAPIGEDKKRPRARKVLTVGKPSSTRFTVLARSDRITAVRAEPLTGRTHQIRVHLSHLGAPILGDRLYSGPMAVRLRGEILRVERVMLHARALTLDLGGGHVLRFEAEVPGDMQRLLPW